MDSPLIVGSLDDVHVQAVAERLARIGVQPLLFDVSSFQDGRSAADLLLSTASEALGRRGWIRRLAPSGWAHDVLPRSHDGARITGWSTLVTGVVQSAQCRWLTRLPDLLSAENKILQLTVARRLRIPIPKTVTARSTDDLRRAGFSTAVVKPLGRAHYTDDDGNERVVPAQLVDIDDLQDEEVAGAPFLFQEPILAMSHLRIVTVRDRSWVASLDADGLPLDWRFHDPAHESFRPASHRHQREAAAATTLAHELALGYSSQDWVVDRAGRAVFLDMNPAGQWLFLPPEVAEEVTEHLAQFLSEPAT